jgi:hypothetical protein
MGQLLAEIAVLGLVSGLDPLAFIAVLVVSAQRRRNGLAFVAGWLLVLVVLSLAPATVLHGSAAGHRPVTHRHLRAWIYLVLGVVLIGLALHAWQLGRRHDPNDVPRWYRRLQRVGPKTSFVTGCLLPSFPAALAAGAAIFHAGISFHSKFVVLGVFLTVSSLIVIVPAAMLYVAPGTAPQLARLNSWAFVRRHTVTFLVLGAIGVFLVARSVFRLVHGV